MEKGTTIYIVKGDLLFTDYQIDSVHLSKESAEMRILELEEELKNDDLACFEENIECYKFAGWIICELEVMETVRT